MTEAEHKAQQEAAKEAADKDEDASDFELDFGAAAMGGGDPHDQDHWAAESAAPRPWARLWASDEGTKNWGWTVGSLGEPAGW